MADKELTKRYKRWCREATLEKVKRETLDGQTITIGPLDRNAPTTALVLHSDRGEVLAMRSLFSILSDTARRIDANANSPKSASSPKGAEPMVVDSKTLLVCLANLCAYEDENKSRNGLGIQLLPFTFGRWVAKIHVQDDTKGSKTTEEKLSAIFNQIAGSDRFRYVAVHRSYTGLARGDAMRKDWAQSMLKLRDKDAPLMDVLGKDLDAIDTAKLGDPNIVGLYLCRKSMVKWVEESAHKTLKSFMMFSPSTPVDHVLATRLYEASRVYGHKSLFPIERFASMPGSGPILREIPNLVTRAKFMVRENRGMIQVTHLLERLTRVMLQVEGQRDGSKERGMLHNLRRATERRPSKDLVFFLNSTHTEGQEDQETFPPPVLSDFDLQENSSGTSKPSWAKSLKELERITGHDTMNDMRGSTTVTMVGFPFQCTFVLANKTGENFYYCPHRFNDRQDATEHVRKVHQGDGLTGKTYAKIAQLDSLLEDTDFGKSMQAVNELELLHKLGLDEKDPEKLRLRPTLHQDVNNMSRAIVQNSRLLRRLEKTRSENIEKLKSLNRQTESADTATEAPQQLQLFNALNREITELQKYMLSPATVVRLQNIWGKAKSRKNYITSNMYRQFVEANDQFSLLDRTLGEDARRYKEKVETLGGVDPGATPSGLPGGGIRVGKSNIIGMLTQDLIEQSRHLEVVQDTNEALIATNRKATFERVATKCDQHFGASNVIPATTPLLAAKGWDDSDEEDEEHNKKEDERKEEDGEELVHREQMPDKHASQEETTSESNPLKRARPKDRGPNEKPSEERALVVIPSKKQFLQPVVPTFLKNVLKIEVQRILEALRMSGADKMTAVEKCKQSLCLAFDPRLKDEVAKVELRDALKPWQIRTLMDPLRGKVSVLVLTDPRLIMYPTGILMYILSSCTVLIDRVHERIVGNEEVQCSVLATGICQLLQPRFRLSRRGLQVVGEALKNVLLENIDKGKNGHWDVLTKLVEALNANREGFWNWALLRRYHRIDDPSHKTKHVDQDPEKTYAPSEQLLSVDDVASRLRLPRVSETSAVSVSPKNSSSRFSALRSEEAQTLIDEVTQAVSRKNATLVCIHDPEDMDPKGWIHRLLQGNANSVDEPHTMCTWFRGKRVTSAECTDEEKHQWLRQASCYICTDPLGSVPFRGWCCLSGVSSLDSLVEQALRDETDPIRRSVREEDLRQKLVATIVAQPMYPSFHFWHRHCKDAEDERRLVTACMKAKKTGEKVEEVAFDECPMCCTKYPRDEASLPSMDKISKRIKEMEREVTKLVPVDSQTPLPMLPSPSSPHTVIQSGNSNEEDRPMNDVEESGESDAIMASETNKSRLPDLARTGIAYLGTLFQAESGCQPSPAALIPPSPVVPHSDHGLTLYDSVMHPSDDPDRAITEAEQALEANRTINVTTTSVAANPLHIGDLNDILDEVVCPPDLNAALEDARDDFDPTDFLEFLRMQSSNLLTQNIEAAALGEEPTREDRDSIHQAQPLEPVANTTPFESSNGVSAAAIGGSGPCNRNCAACPFMVPRSNQIATYRLTTPIDCNSNHVLFVSICHSCAKAHRLDYSFGSIRARVVELQAGGGQKVLSKCPLGHVPTIVGLEHFTADDDLMKKAAEWRSRFGAISSVEAILR